VTASLGGGRCSEGGLGGKPERTVHVAVLGGQGCSTEARRGKCEGEPFSVELAEVIGEREGGACGHGKPWRGHNPWVVHGGRKTTAPAVAVVWTGDMQYETNSASVTVALGQAQIRCTLIFPIIQTLLKFCNSNLLPS
jgi:hypothetical protein